MWGLLLTALLAQAAPRPPQQQRVSPQPQPSTTKSPRLSGEDEELVKQLALLERVELLRNLELFEGGLKDEDQSPQTRAP